MIRFQSKTKPNKNGCIDWTDSLATNGYGKFYMNGKEIMAYRAAWILFVGPIPDGRHVLHKCDRRSCVNVDHLKLGTHNDNMKDMMNRNRVNRNNKWTKLTIEKVREIRKKFASGIKQPVLAKEYGVHRSNIGLIVRRKAWSFVE
jgi:DNA-binding transcriptional regulator YiaG